MANLHAVVVSGVGRYADPWHPFAETSGCIAELIGGAGFDVEVDENVDDRLADLSGVDLLVVNLGRPTGASDADAASRAGLLRYVAEGKPLLVSHASTMTLPGTPEWEAIVGAVWVDGGSFHPDYGRSHVEVVDHEHPITAGISDFELDDERYSGLRISNDLHVLAQHRSDGQTHPLLWTHDYGASRIVCDALGHDSASYESAEHCELVRRAARWLVDS